MFTVNEIRPFETHDNYVFDRRVSFIDTKNNKIKNEMANRIEQDIPKAITALTRTEFKM